MLACVLLPSLRCLFMVCSDVQVDIVPREERDDAAMIPRVPQPMTGAMPGTKST